jgi:hypothetical protein
MMGVKRIDQAAEGTTTVRRVEGDELRAILELSGPLDADGFYGRRQLPDGRWLAVLPLTFQRARLGISMTWTAPLEAAFALGFADLWDYDTRELALAALTTWDGTGEPTGWVRHPATGRRRTPTGTIASRQIYDATRDAQLLALLRRDVAAGAGHECDEWQVAGRCALCDRPSKEAP